MALTSEMFIGSTRVLGTESNVKGINPATGEDLEPEFGLGGQAEVDRATTLAAEAFDTYRNTSPEDRAALLERIADNIEAIGDELIERGSVETGLPTARLTSERGRTTGQLRLFAWTLRQGIVSGVRIDPAQPDRNPLPRLDIRQRKIAIGPVAVFGSSNFPLAFSVAGGDTASALAAGCPVIVKAHNAHPGTSALVAEAIVRAVEASGLPQGVFSMLFGDGRGLGSALVAHPVVQAVGFTGSRSGGTALMRVAAERKQPIPVYAEMSSINPVFVLPGALAEASADVAKGFVDSLVLGSGQFCTNPGMVFVPSSDAGDEFVAHVVELVADAVGQPMLTPGICESFSAAVESLGSRDGVTRLVDGKTGESRNAPPATVFESSAAKLATDPELQEEMFGAASLILRYDTVDELLDGIRALEGQLTATIHLRDEDTDTARRLASALELKVGRILANGWPTGVEVNHSMVHGGPFPATSDSRTTSVGTLAMERFQRPVSYQNLPDALLPEPIRSDNPWNQVRMVDGAFE